MGKDRIVCGKSRALRSSKIKERNVWTIEETQELFQLYKEYGTRWTTIAQHLPRHDENDAKNKFYTTLKRVATQAQLEDPIRYGGKLQRCKKNLVQFVDVAMKYSHLVPSKKGRKKNADKIKARTEGILFPKVPPLPQPILPSMTTGPGAQWAQSVYLAQAPVQYMVVPLYHPMAPVFHAGGVVYGLAASKEHFNNCNARYQVINNQFKG